VVRPCGQSACSEIALTTRDDLVVQVHRSAGRSTSPRSTALYPHLCYWPGRSAAAGNVAFRNSRWSSSLISIQAPKSGRRAVHHECAPVIGREILAPRPSRRNRCSAVVLRAARHLGIQRPRHVHVVGADRDVGCSMEHQHADWFPLVTKISALILFPPRPDSNTTAVGCAADVACLHAAGGGYSRQLLLERRQLS
jgi:hypothetical protein